eukprot:TRINITY_DN1146_c0_g1_i3.p1 TRINITY_DN1146_c0_g1~~TRINITY_DN1146_c0_g1_i3.p1  ORF type:complete len:212 (-),score=70.55 TRINITY_DN1146_c0_g1_i3:104-739(-)
MVTGFEEVFEEVFKEGERKCRSYSEHPLYKEISLVHEKLMRELKHDGVDCLKGLAIGIKLEDDKADFEYKACMDEEYERNREKSCDQIFAEYLGFVAQKVSAAYYSNVLCFVLLFRECISSYGQLLVEQRKTLPAFLFPEHSRVNDYTTDYCCDNNGEQIPDMCNKFLTQYIKDKRACVHLEDSELIDLMQNLCYWLFFNGYTCSKINLIE